MGDYPAVDHRRVRRTVKKVVEIAGVGVIAMLGYFLLPLDGNFSELFVGVFVLVGAVALVPLSFRRARQVLVSDQPLLVAAQSLFSTIMLLTVSFASVYYVLAKQYQDEVNGISTKIDALYFTVTIMGTVGFGDITATGQTGRAIVTAHMAVNFVVLAVAVRVVAWALQQRRDIAALAPGGH